jgi:glycosyltransferase involved in cell wall biosynthesis
MSGVLVLAGSAGMPVLGTRHGEIGRLIAKHGLGWIVSIDRPAELTAALLEMRDARTRTEMGQRARTAFAGHTAENFAAEILDAIRCQESISDSKPP